MNIVLKTADFSANNIGQTLVLRASEVTADAHLSLMTSQPSESIIYAFRDFIFKLKAGSIWDKIQVLILPAIGYNIPDALLDVKGGVGFTTYPGYDPADMVTLINHSLKYNGGGTGENKINLTLNLQDYHMAVFSNNGGVDNKSTSILKWEGNYSDELKKGFAQTIYNYPNPIDLNPTVWNGFFGISNKSNLVTSIANDTSEVAVNSGSFTFTGGNAFLYDLSQVEHYSLISLGNGMTQSEMLYYKNCCKLLMSVVNSNS